MSDDMKNVKLRLLDGLCIYRYKCLDLYIRGHDYSVVILVMGFSIKGSDGVDREWMDERNCYVWRKFKHVFCRDRRRMFVLT